MVALKAIVYDKEHTVQSNSIDGSKYKRGARDGMISLIKKNDIFQKNNKGIEDRNSKDKLNLEQKASKDKVYHLLSYIYFF